MLLQLWFEAASAGYRAEAAFTTANIDLCWKMGIQAQSSPGVRILHGISSFPKLSLDFSWPVLAMRNRWPLVKLPCSRKKLLMGWRSQCTSQVCCCLHMHGEKAARQPGILCGHTLVPAARNGRHGTKRDNSDGEQIHLYLENSFGNFAATCSGSHYFTGACPHFKHLQLQFQVFYFNRSLKDESMEQSWKLSTAALSGSSCM